MPVYEYRCDPCRVIYSVHHGMNDKPDIVCPKCEAAAERIISAPNVITESFSSPTEARYSKMSDSDEIAREKELQKDYQTVWPPPPVKHSSWDDDH